MRDLILQLSKSSIYSTKPPDTSNCNGYQVTIIPHEDGFGNFHWFRGAYRLSGHFYIDALAVPYQGLMVAVISAAKTI